LHFPDESRRTCFVGGAPELWIVVGGECHGPDLRRHSLHQAAGLECVQPATEAEIKQNDIGPKLHNAVEQGVDIGHASNHIAGKRQQSRNSRRYLCVVIGQ
jgi:hypothetical protein